MDLSTLPTVSKLLYYPLIFFVCWFWSLLRRAWNVFGDADEAPVALIGLQIFFSNMYGFANAMMYGWIVRHHLKAASKQISESSKEKVATVSATDVTANVQEDTVASKDADDQGL